jgi:hypothetical protein
MLATCPACCNLLHFSIMTILAVLFALMYYIYVDFLITDYFDNVFPMYVFIGLGNHVEALSYKFRHWMRTLTGAATAVLSF